MHLVDSSGYVLFMYLLIDCHELGFDPICGAGRNLVLFQGEEWIIIIKRSRLTSGDRPILP